MNLNSRKALDRSLTGVGALAIGLMSLSLVILLGPFFIRGSQAFVFRATVEHRRLMFTEFARGGQDSLNKELAAVKQARAPVFAAMTRFEEELPSLPLERRGALRKEYREVQRLVRSLFGPLPGDDPPVLLREVYGQTRWDRALVKLDELLHVQRWDYSRIGQMGRQVRDRRQNTFAGTALEPLFPVLEGHLGEMLRPRLTFYWQFLIDESRDAHFFGGIGPEILGTFYLAFGAMLLAIPFGVIAAVYLSEFAGSGRLVSLLRVFVSTLAGVPSIVFGLFGLAFFINTLHLSRSKSVLAGAATLALLILPTIIRAAEEAIKAVPQTYREAALSLGASPLRMVLTVLLPAALPGILTGIIISIGRAAGETAPIIFTAAVSVGQPLKLIETLSQPTPALSWNIYNLATEHEAVGEIRHVQFGMVLTLVLLVLALNLAAILLRARLARRNRG